MTLEQAHLVLEELRGKVSELQQEAIDTLAHASSLRPLTRREKEIARLIAEGYPNREIGAKLSISLQTVKNNLRSIFDKLGIGNRVELALYVLAQSAAVR